MWYVGEATAGLLGDVVQRGEDDAGYAELLGDVGDVAPLLVLELAVGRLPVVCHEENSMGVFEGGLEGLGGVEICLYLC